jgi:hypothetical protein
MSFFDLMLSKKKKRWDKQKYVERKQKEILLPSIEEDEEEFEIQVDGGRYVKNSKIRYSEAL